MNSVYEVQQLLKRFGIFVYTGDRTTDLTMMRLELRDLYNNNMIDLMTYQQGSHLLKKGQ